MDGTFLNAEGSLNDFPSFQRKRFSTCLYCLFLIGAFQVGVESRDVVDICKMGLEFTLKSSKDCTVLFTRVRIYYILSSCYF